MEGFFTQREFQKAAEAGAFLKVVVRAGWANFEIEGEMRGGGRARLIPTRDAASVRKFANPAAALALLKKMGITKVEVQTEAWDLEVASLSMRHRPDVTARRLRDRRIAEAAYYPQRPKESGEISREDQLGKLLEKKAQEAARIAG
jgi:hypothetical protein